MEQDELVTLELKCCCCGTVLDTLATPWRRRWVRVEAIWTSSPCRPCEARLHAQPLSVYDPRD